MQTAINPFYAARILRDAALPQEQQRPLYAKLPLAPRNASPVPHLTSLYHFDRAGEYGDRSYPGNCGGNIIKDLLLYFKPGNVFDPFSGSGTCQDVCKELGIPCSSLDLRFGQDACNPASYPRVRRFDFIWSHPPYWRQKVYTTDHRDLSQQPTLERFLERYRRFIECCGAILAPGGRFAVLMGDYSDRDAGFVPLTYHTKRLAFEAGLVQCCTDIIRFSHGASSAKKTYRSSFIPGLHDVCMVFTNTAGKEAV
jgi:hypothetical protein